MSDTSEEIEAERQKLMTWLETQDFELEVFLTMEFDGLPDDPYTPEGLDIVETKLLDTFPSLEAATENDETTSLLFKYVRFLGETYKRQLKGDWDVCGEDEGGTVGETIIRYKVGAEDRWYPPVSNVTVALLRRNPSSWSQLLTIILRNQADGGSKVFDD